MRFGQLLQEGIYEMNSVAREEAATEVVTPPSTEQTPVYRMQLQPRAHVTFDDSVVDNEHLGRKRSNKCCIFHKKRDFGESSSESDEDSDDASSGGEHKHKHHALDCKHKVRRRTKTKKRVPSPSSSEEEKMPAPPQ